MVKILTAFTAEIDEVDVAISEILAALDLKKNQRKNSVALIHCFKDFIQTGVISALAEALPFDMLGCTTMGCAVPGGMSQLALAVTVLTSDDVEFFTAVSDSIRNDITKPLKNLKEQLLKKTAQKPAVVFPFVPFMRSFGGDEFAEELQNIFPETPVFGTVSITNDTTLLGTMTIYNGAASSDIVSVAALVGNVSPQFLSVSVIEEHILRHQGIITAANKNVLKTINEIPAVQYLKTIGLSQSGSVSGLESMPFIVELKNGVRLTRTMIAATDDESIICSGKMPVDAQLSIAIMGSDDTVSSTADLVSTAKKKAQGKSLLMYSCAARCWALGGKDTLEMEEVAQILGRELSYHFIYSGGELFPAHTADGTLTCQLQNSSLIICIL